MNMRGWEISESFFDVAEAESVDGGTTSRGPLWHSTSNRWGHSMHSMCSYHGMFPARLAHYFIQRFTQPGDLVMDPFSGRGTVPLQARVEGRRTICNDLSPLGYVLSSAKARPPAWESVQHLVSALERAYPGSRDMPDVSPDIRMLFHWRTLQQICYIRDFLLTEPSTRWAPEKRMLAGALCGIMHGAHRRDGTSQYLSISMPNTFSMSPRYVEKYIQEKGLVGPDQDVFERVRDKLARLYLDGTEGPDGDSLTTDATSLLLGGEVAPNSVDLLLTSPPYLRVVNYGTANWIRLWLLGIEEVGTEQGEGRKHLDSLLDHRHSFDSYKKFMAKMFRGVERVLSSQGVAAVVIGDVLEAGKDRVPLAEQIWDAVGSSTSLRLVDLVEDLLPIDKKVSRIWGETRGQATDRDCILLLAHREADVPEIAGIVDWDEPYKDAGPDAAHARVRR